jgi:hypothetical protein
LLHLPCFQPVCMHSSRGRCIGSGGACMCAGGALCGFSSFDLVVCALCLSLVFVSDVSSRCPCLRVRDLSSSSDLVLRLRLVFDHLLKDRYGEPERGERMGADKNSSRRRWKLLQDEHGFQHTSPTLYPSWPSPRSH